MSTSTSTVNANYDDVDDASTSVMLGEASHAR